MRWLCLALMVVSSANSQMNQPRVERGIEYQPLPIRQYLDIVRPQGPGPFPAVVVIPGGGFRGGSRSDLTETCLHIASAGFVAIAVDYRKLPQQLFPAPVNDVKSAIRWVRANAHRLSLDPDRLGAIGFEAGGYLAAFAAVTGDVAEFEGIGPHRKLSSRIRCAVGMNAVLNVRQLDADVRNSFLGGDPEHAEVLRRADPLNWITPNAAPVLLLGKGSQPAAEFVQRMSFAGVRSAGISAGSAGEELTRAIGFLREHLAATPQTRIVVSDHGPDGEVVLMDWPSGKEIWHAPNRRGHDAQALRNGNVLVTLDEDGAVVEYDPHQPNDGNIVWRYGPAEGLKLTISAERLANGNTMIADTGTGKLVEISPEEKLVWEYVNPDLAGNRMRHCRSTPAGTVLIAVEAAGKLIEVDRSGKIVWSWSAPSTESRRPYQGLRLANGNTMISLMGPGEIIEVTPAGKIVRSIGGNSSKLRIGWASGFDLLPNGNVIAGDYTGQRLIEIDSSGKAIHDLRMRHRPATVAVAP